MLLQRDDLPLALLPRATAKFMKAEPWRWWSGAQPLKVSVMGAYGLRGIPYGPFSLSQTDGVSLPAPIPGGGSAKICFSYTAPTSGQLPSETVTFVMEGWNGVNPSMTL